MDKVKLETVVAAIDGYKDEGVRLQTELCKYPALGPESGGEGEEKKAEFLKEYLAQIGFVDIQQYDARDDRVPCGYRPNLVALMPGQVDSPTVWIMTHMDVVPPGDMSKWTSDPWTVRVDGDKMIGRGCEDNQQGMVSSLLAAKAFAATGTKPYLPYGLILCADEETGNQFGVQYLLERHRNLFSKDDLIIIPDSGNPTGSEIEVAEKSILWMKFHTQGRQTHGSTPEKGRNAHKAACYLAHRLETLYSKFRKRDDVFEPPISTFEATKRESNVPNVNTIPGEDIMYFDCRILPEYKISDVTRYVRTVMKETEKKYKVKIKLDLTQSEKAAPPTPVDAPVANAVARAVKDLRKRKPKSVGIGGGTVAKYFREKGFPCVVWATLDERAHTADEYGRISAMIADAKVFAHVALQEDAA